jgi:hypothetical protein
VLSGRPLIGAWVNRNGLIQMTVGSYYWNTSGPISTYERTTSQLRWEISSRFISLLDPVTLEWVDGPVEKTVAEKVYNFSGQRRISFGTDTFFRLTTGYYYCRYDSETQQIVFAKF